MASARHFYASNCFYLALCVVAYSIICLSLLIQVSSKATKASKFWFFFYGPENWFIKNMIWKRMKVVWLYICLPVQSSFFMLFCQSNFVQIETMPPKHRYFKKCSLWRKNFHYCENNEKFLWQFILAFKNTASFCFLSEILIQFELFQKIFRRFISSLLTNVLLALNSILFFDSFFGVKKNRSLIALCFSLKNFQSFLSFSSRFCDVSSDSTVFSRKITGSSASPANSWNKQALFLSPL